MSEEFESVRTRLLCGLCLAGLLAAVALPPASAADWRNDPVWDDGKAEFCVYEIDWWRYGRLNPGQALLIAVKEPWAPDLDVKADEPRANGFEVLKLNHLRDVPTGIYTYHQMASSFLRRDSGALQKLAVTSSEGCGISVAQMVRGRLNVRSYFDGQGDTITSYPEHALPADGLALFLREYLDGPLPESVSVFPSLMTGRFPDLAPERFALQRRKGALEVPAGSFDTLELELSGKSGWMRFAFAATAPHPLIRYEDYEGTTYRLAKCERIPYWRMNGPGGEEWYPETLR